MVKPDEKNRYEDDKPANDELPNPVPFTIAAFYGETFHPITGSVVYQHNPRYLKHGNADAEKAARDWDRSYTYKAGPIMILSNWYQVAKYQLSPATKVTGLLLGIVGIGSIGMAAWKHNQLPHQKSKRKK